MDGVDGAEEGGNVKDIAEDQAQFVDPHHGQLVAGEDELDPAIVALHQLQELHVVLVRDTGVQDQELGRLGVQYLSRLGAGVGQDQLEITER